MTSRVMLTTQDLARPEGGGTLGVHLGKVPVADICTHQLPLAEFDKAFSLVEDSSGDSVKVSLLSFG